MNSLSNLIQLPQDEKESRGIAHTPAEIAQQPESWLTTYELFQKRHDEIRNFLGSAGLFGESALRPVVFLVGAGTSDYVGRALTQLLRHRWQCEVLAVPSTDLLTHAEESLVADRTHLWITFSRSGESPEGIAVIESALRDHPGIHHLIVTCNAQATMLRITRGLKQVFGIALPDKVHDRGLAMTSSFSNMIVFGQALANVEDLERYEEIVKQLVEAGNHFRGAAANLAQQLAGVNFTRVCFLGSGALKAVATESALKVLELTAGRIQTMSESALGLRHGPMAALDSQTLLVAFLSVVERVRRYELDLLAEIGRKHLVRSRVAVSAEPDPEFGKVAEHVLVHTPPLAIADDYRAPLDVMFGQLLGLFFSLRCGLKPDCPSPNGAISRVVQNVLIHS